MSGPADWGPFERCPRCEEYDWRNRHCCPPRFYGRLAGEEDWIEVYAKHAEFAAEAVAERRDEEDPRIAYENRAVTVEVTEDPEAEKPRIRRYEVEGALVPRYRATECGT